MIGRIVLAVLLSLASSPALSADVKIGEVSLKLPPPRGYCEMSTKEPSDARFIEFTTTVANEVGNQLLAASADCTQLTSWRRGARPLLDDMALYQTQSANVGTNYTPDMIKQTCDRLQGSQGEKIASDVLPKGARAVEETTKTIKVNEMRFVGVLDEDATACYAAAVQKLSTEVGTEKTQFILFAVTVVKARLVFYYLISVYQDANTPTAMLSKHKANVSALLAANK